MPGTAKVLGSNLTRSVFFFQTGNVPFHKKLSAHYLPSYVLSAFFYIIVAFSVLVYL